MNWEIIKAVIVGATIVSLILIAEAYVGVLCYEISNKLYCKFRHKFNYSENSALFFVIIGIFIFVLINIIVFLLGIWVWLSTK